MSALDAIASAQVKDAAPLFAALGDETRLRVVVRLSAGGPLSITRLATQFAVSRQAITKHLEVLSEARLVRSTRRGRERIWSLDPKRFDAAHRYLDRISKQWDDALGRLQRFVEPELDG
jgi:DNA-binding transcriptional ArsR family regulator